LGLLPGLIAGYFRGRVDAVLVRIADAFIVFPGIILAIAVVGILGPSLAHAMLAVGIVAWPGLFRVVRGSVFQVREESFVAAARTMGGSDWYLITRQILPVVMTPIFVTLALVASVMLLAEAGLSFIGLGVQPPFASWGSMISDGQRFISVQPWLAVFPGLAITLSALSFNIISDGLSRAYSRRGLSVPDA
jgi:peptide/nickel transport system permease protein